jgi:hypothetical protein
MDTMSVLLVSQVDYKIWKGEFKSEYLEDISRKTGRELSYLQFVQMLNQALMAQESNK